MIVSIFLVCFHVSVCDAGSAREQTTSIWSLVKMWLRRAQYTSTRKHTTTGFLSDDMVLVVSCSMERSLGGFWLDICQSRDAFASGAILRCSVFNFPEEDIMCRSQRRGSWEDGFGVSEAFVVFGDCLRVSSCRTSTR